MSAKVTRGENKSNAEEIGLSLIRGVGMPFAEVDLDDHIAAVTVYGSTQREANERATLLARGWNLVNDEGK